MVDFCSTLDAVTLEQHADLIMQQIEILFDTNPGEVLGDLRFGANFDDYLYNANIGNETAARDIERMIRTNVELFDWDMHVDVEFLVGSENDILIMHLTLTHGEEAYTKTYKITEGSIQL